MPIHQNESNMGYRNKTNPKIENREACPAWTLRNAVDTTSKGAIAGSS
jgi:hypothetical protein